MAAALTATLRADITNFERGILLAETKITGLQKSTSQINRELAKFGNDFGGANLIRQANSMVRAVEDLGGATKLTSAEQKRLTSTVDEALAKYRALGQEVPPSLKMISAELQDIRKAEEAATKSANELALASKKASAEQIDGFKQAGAGAGTFKGLLGGLGTAIAGAFTIGAVINFGKEIVALGSQITDLSQRTGLSVKAVQEFKYAADQTGSSIETFAGAVTKFSDKLVSGDKSALKAVKDLGLSFEQLRQLSPEEAFTQVADAIGKIPDPMRQTQVALDLFGKSGAEILPAIKQGFSGLREEANKFGQVLSAEDVKALDDFGDRFGQVMTGMKVAAAKATLEIATGFKDLFNEITGGLKDLGLAEAFTELGKVSGVRFADAFAEVLKQTPLIGGALEVIQGLQERARNPAPPPVPRSGFTGETDNLSPFGGGGGGQPAAPKVAQLIDEDALKRAAAAAERYADQIRAAIEKANGVEVQRQIKLVGDAYAGLSTAEKNNATVVRALLEPYEKLRQETNVLPLALERARTAFQKPLASRDLFTSFTTGADGVETSVRKIVTVMPDLARTTQGVQNIFAGLTRDGLIPATKSFGGMADTIDATRLKTQAIAGTFDTVKDQSIDLRGGLSELARGFSDLAQISGGSLDGVLGDIANLIGLMAIAAQAGSQLKAGIDQIRQGGSANITAGAITAASGAVSAVGSLNAATNVMGRGNRAARGAATGAAIGTQILPGYGTAVGAIVGALVGALRNPAFEDVFKRVAKNFGVAISEETSKAIAKVAKDTFKGDRGAAEIFSLDAIIAEGGGIKPSTVATLQARLRDAFSLREVGKFSAEQLDEVLTKNFGSFANYVNSQTTIASKGFSEILRLAKAFNATTEEMRAFVSDQASIVGGGVAALAQPLISQFAGIQDQIATARKDAEAAAAAAVAARGGKKPEDMGVEDTAKAKTADAAAAAAAAKLAELLAKVKDGAAGAQEEFNRLGVIALAGFNAARDSGLGYVEALDQIGPGLDQLIQLQKDLGLEGSAALDSLSHFRELVTQNETLVTSAEALNETILALSKIGGLTTDSLAAMEGQGLQTFDRLTEAGFSNNEALELMRGFIENVILAHEQLGIPIDENTQKLIDQAKAAGLLKKSGDDMIDVFKEGFGALITTLGGELPDAWKKTTAAAVAAAKGINQAVKDIDVKPVVIPVEFELPDGRMPWDEGYGRPPGGGSPYPGNPGNVPGLASGGIVLARSGGTLVRLGEGGRSEAVVPLGSGRVGGTDDAVVAAVQSLAEAIDRKEFVGQINGDTVLRFVAKNIGQWVRSRDGGARWVA